MNQRIAIKLSVFFAVLFANFSVSLAPSLAQTEEIPPTRIDSLVRESGIRYRPIPSLSASGLSGSEGVFQARMKLEIASGLKIGRADQNFNMAIVFFHDFKQLMEIEHRDPRLVQTFSQVYGRDDYLKNLKSDVGDSISCFLKLFRKDIEKITVSYLLVNSTDEPAAKALCIVRGFAASLGITDRELIEEGIFFDEAEGMVIVTDQVTDTLQEKYKTDVSR